MMVHRNRAGLAAVLFCFLFWVPEAGCGQAGDGPEAAGQGKAAAVTKKDDNLTFTILYDNNQYDRRLETAWGFSCLIQGLEKTILFDTGGDSRMLLSNMRKLGLDPKIVDAVIISHIHYDHFGGLAGFLEENHNVTVYLPRYLPAKMKKVATDAGARLVEVHEPIKICAHAYSTGELGGWIKEQSLVVETGKGLVVVTGCAHPGIANIVKQAKHQLNQDVYLALGGFHLCWMKSHEIKGIVEGVKREGVKQVAPCHCSGDLARKLFGQAYGKNFILLGVGRSLEVSKVPDKVSLYAGPGAVRSTQ